MNSVVLIACLVSSVARTGVLRADAERVGAMGSTAMVLDLTGWSVSAAATPTPVRKPAGVGSVTTTAAGLAHRAGRLNRGIAPGAHPSPTRDPSQGGRGGGDAAHTRPRRRSTHRSVRAPRRSAGAPARAG